MTRRIFRATNIVLFLLCLMYFLTYVDRVNVATAVSAFRKEFSLNNMQVGFLFSAFAYPYFVFQILGGWLADRYGAHKVLTVCGLVWATSTILMGLVHTFLWMIAARLLLGLGEGATFPTATRAMASWTPVGKRGFAQGLVHSFARLGNSITPWFVATLIAAFSWRASFVLVGILSTAWALGWALYFRDNPAKHKGITQEELAILPNISRKREKIAVPWKPVLKRMFPVVVVYFCYGWTLYMFMGWLPSFFNAQFHLNLKNSALFASSVFFAGVSGDTLGGVVSDWLFHKTKDAKIARTYVIAASMLLCCLSVAPIMYTRNLTLVALSLSSAFFWAEMTIGPMWAVPMDIAPKFSGTASAIMNMGAALAAIISPLLFGYIVDKTGSWTLPFYGSMVLMLFGTALAFTMHPELPLAEAGEAKSAPAVAGA
jgi:MFS family permease